MKLKTQKTLVAKILGCSNKRISFVSEHLSDIKEAITRQDLKGLIGQGIIRKKQKKGVSKVRARKYQIQKRKGKRRGHGSRKGKKTARLPKKHVWMSRIRVQRAFLKRLIEKEKISNKDYRALYIKSKGGFFRSKRHLQLFITEKGLMKK